MTKYDELPFSGSTHPRKCRFMELGELIQEAFLSAADAEFQTYPNTWQVFGKSETLNVRLDPAMFHFRNP
jgi:hypothetical protein